jgi:type I restriction enzyme S subunit
MKFESIKGCWGRLEEQKEISRILRTVLDSEEQAKDTAEHVIEQIDIMKKSILAKAFRRELGTNNSDEESQSSY